MLRALIFKRPDIVTPKCLAQDEFGSSAKTTLQGDEFGHISKDFWEHTGPWGVISVLGLK